MLVITFLGRHCPKQSVLCSGTSHCQLYDCICYCRVGNQRVFKTEHEHRTNPANLKHTRPQLKTITQIFNTYSSQIQPYMFSIDLTPCSFSVYSKEPVTLGHPRTISDFVKARDRCKEPLRQEQGKIIEVSFTEKRINSQAKS